MDYDLKTVTVWFPFEIILFLLKYQKPPEKGMPSMHTF